MGDHADVKYKATSNRDDKGQTLTVDGAVLSISKAFKGMQAMWELNLQMKSAMDKKKKSKFQESDGESGEDSE